MGMRATSVQAEADCQSGGRVCTQARHDLVEVVDELMVRIFEEVSACTHHPACHAGSVDGLRVADGLG